MLLIYKTINLTTQLKYLLSNYGIFYGNFEPQLELDSLHLRAESEKVKNNYCAHLGLRF